LKLANLGGKLVDALPDRGESERRCFQAVGRSAIGRCRWRYPGKVSGPSSDRLSDPATVRLPNYAGSKANDENDQDAGKGERD